MLTGNRDNDRRECARLSVLEELAAVIARASGLIDRARLCDAAALRFRTMAESFS